MNMQLFNGFQHQVESLQKTGFSWCCYSVFRKSHEILFSNQRKYRNI